MGRGRQAARGACWALVSGLAGVTLLQPALAAAPVELRVTGDVSGLVAGAPSVLVLTVHNPGEQSASVAALEVRVTSDGGVCPASALVVAPWRGHLSVPGHGSTAQPVRVLLQRDCGTARFALTYTASGT